MARDFDLLLCLFPFEKDWYARHVPEFASSSSAIRCLTDIPPPSANPSQVPVVLLLPGSRRAELKRHLPVILGAARLIAARQPARFKLVAPSEGMAALVRAFPGRRRAGNRNSDRSIGRSLVRSHHRHRLHRHGDIGMRLLAASLPSRCIRLRLWTYLIARQIVTVKYLSMPNLLADEPLFPEFIQHQATAAKT
jgi:lipid-A-disaccharide synthase